MKILFTIPTLYNTPAITQECTSQLLESTKAFERDIYVVANQATESFNSWKVEEPVHKKSSELAYNISRAINVGLDALTDHDYFCFVDEGLRFKEGWLEEFISIYTEYDNVGVLGNRPHSTFKSYNVPLKEDLYEVLWTDGVMLIKADRIESIGRFDESYFADCETQDYCYRAMQQGYKNLYYHSKKIEHKKSITSQSIQIADIVSKSRRLLDSRWGEWREKMYRI